MKTRFQLQPPFPPQPNPIWVPTTPVGAIIAYCGQLPSAGDKSSSPPNSVPVNDVEAQGWMVCDGRTLKVSQYPELFAVLGYLYGKQAEGEFQIPDYRGMFLRGVDGGSGNDPDVSDRTAPPGGTNDSTGSTQQDALQTHVHNYKTFSPATAPGQGNAAGEPSPASTPTDPPTTTTGEPEVQVSNNETRPINIYVYYLIKYTNRPDVFQIANPANITPM